MLPSLTGLLKNSFCADEVLISERNRSISSSEFFSGHEEIPSLSRILIMSTYPIPFCLSSAAFSMARVMQQSAAMMFPLNSTL